MPGREDNPLDKLSADARAREAYIIVLEKRVAEVEAENRQLWEAMRSTGEALGQLLPRGEWTPFRRH